ncbi:MAG: hypothetical protein RLP02_23010, partial [Coleofasciculus sp. C2-GNP5-27]
MEPPIIFRQNPPSPNLSPNQKPNVGAGLGTNVMESPITFLQNPPWPNFDIFLVRSRLRIRWVWLSSLGLI